MRISEYWPPVRKRGEGIIAYTGRQREAEKKHKEIIRDARELSSKQFQEKYSNKPLKI